MKEKDLKYVFNGFISMAKGDIVGFLEKSVILQLSPSFKHVPLQKHHPSWDAM